MFNIIVLKNQMSYCVFNSGKQCITIDVALECNRFQLLHLQSNLSDKLATHHSSGRIEVADVVIDGVLFMEMQQLNWMDWLQSWVYFNNPCLHVASIISSNLSIVTWRWATPEVLHNGHLEYNSQKLKIYQNWLTSIGGRNL